MSVHFFPFNLSTYNFSDGQPVPSTGRDGCLVSAFATSELGLLSIMHFDMHMHVQSVRHWVRVRAPSFGTRHGCFQIPALSLAIWVALDVVLHFSQPQAPHLGNGNTSYLTVDLSEFYITSENPGPSELLFKNGRFYSASHHSFLQMQKETWSLFFSVRALDMSKWIPWTGLSQGERAASPAINQAL